MFAARSLPEAAKARTEPSHAGSRGQAGLDVSSAHHAQRMADLGPTLCRHCSGPGACLPRVQSVSSSSPGRCSGPPSVGDPLCALASSPGPRCGSPQSSRGSQAWPHMWPVHRIYRVASGPRGRKQRLVAPNHTAPLFSSLLPPGCRLSSGTVVVLSFFCCLKPRSHPPLLRRPVSRDYLALPGSLVAAGDVTNC